MGKIYQNNMAAKIAGGTNSTRASNERQSNDSSRVPFHHRLPSGKSRQQAIRAKTKIYANRNVLANSSNNNVFTPNSQVGSTKNGSRQQLNVQIGQNSSKGTNISIKSSNPKI